MKFFSSYKFFIFWVLFTGVSLFFVHKSFLWFKASTMPDLRIKVVGARLMRDNKMPYFYKWQNNEKEIYCNPYDRPGKLVNGLSTPPSVLWLMQPITNWNYCKIMQFWFWSQEALLMLTGVIVILLLTTLESKVSASIIFFAFICSENWYFSIEQGQIYALYGFAFALIFLIYKKSSYKDIFSASCISFFIWLRPLFILTVLPALFARQKLFLKAFAGTAILLITITTINGHWKYWKEYNVAIKEYSKEVNNQLATDPTHTIALPPTILENCVASTPPILINGAGSLYSLQKYLGDFGIRINNPIFFEILIFILTGAFSLFIQRRQKLSVEQYIVFLYLLYLIGELNSPAARNPYNLVQWAVPSLIIAGSFRENFTSFFLLLLGYILNTEVVHVIKYQRELGEMLLIFAAINFVLVRGGVILKNSTVDSDTDNKNSFSSFSCNN